MSGKVVDSTTHPIANVQVLVLGKQPVKTDAAGAFSIPDVTSPYDIIAVGADKEDVTLFKGLTLRTPTLFVSTAAVVSPRLATLEGKVSGGQTPYTSKNTPALTFIATEVSSDVSPGSLSTGAFSKDVSWTGAASITGTLHALQAVKEGATALPTSFTGYGRRDNITLTEGAKLSGQDVAMSSVTNSTLKGTITVPSGFTLFSASVSLQLSSSSVLSLYNVFTPSTSFTYPVPVIGQSTYSVQAFAATEGFGRTSARVLTALAAGSSSTQLTLQEPPQLTQPADKAADVTRSTTLSWTAFTGGVHTVTLERAPLSPGEISAPYLTIITRDTSTTIPDLSSVGINLPANTSMSWRVTGLAPIASVDALLGRRPDEDPLSGASDTSLGSSEQRDFTTASAP